ncbi:hypothetical protein HanPI659440_Chr02g0046591 [Helianthus annuus]|nr:hypothetical protein HanPI659440_Chr02g0046571 [Helianthus annuus]KAJ0805164.1 hypothetical protein HanPI659440_Chr02g0046581 [Helianthus annuus]KAJ0805165.1 hypothetical protein HanPI659440_Chr02g0046591 [Helianthus annuus]
MHDWAESWELFGLIRGLYGGSKIGSQGGILSIDFGSQYRIPSTLKKIIWASSSLIVIHQHTSSEKRRLDHEVNIHSSF